MGTHNLAFFQTATEGSVKGLNAFIKNLGQPINAKDKDGNTALMLCATYGHLDCVDWLLKNGADVNISDNTEFTPLMVAASGGYIECVRMLIKAGADIDARNCGDRTALMLASSNNEEISVIELINAGANPLLKAKDGTKSMDRVLRFDNKKLLKILVKAEDTWKKKLSLNTQNSIQRQRHTQLRNYLRHSR